MKSAIQQFFSSKYWLETTDNAPLVVFRVIFGFLITCEAWGAICTGWVYGTLIEPDFTFNFIGLDWLQPLPGYGMYAWFLLMGAAGFCVMLGWRYRTAMITYAILWTLVYWMQKSHYNNHYYMAVLLCWIMVFLPANRDFSLDAKRLKNFAKQYCPRWCILLLMCQLAIVYFYASFAKMHLDWIQGLPVEIWFKHKTNYPIIGWIYGLDLMKWSVVWGGIFFDLLIVPLLLWKPTRKIAFALSLFFHLFNSITFQIGIFPYMMIGFSVFFFEAEMVRRIFIDSSTTLTNESTTLTNEPTTLTKQENSWAKLTNNNSIEVSKQRFNHNHIPLDSGRSRTIGWRYKNWVLLPVSVYLIIQILLPLRHFYFEGNVHWTEEGHRMAWHMMLRSKSGSVSFKAKNPETGKITNISPRKYMTKDQARAMAKRPDMIWQFSQRLKKEFDEKGEENMEIYAIARASLNGRKTQYLIDPEVDLAKVKWERFKHADWIVPLKE